MMSGENDDEWVDVALTLRASRDDVRVEHFDVHAFVALLAQVARNERERAYHVVVIGPGLVDPCVPEFVETLEETKLWKLWEDRP